MRALFTIQNYSGFVKANYKQVCQQAKLAKVRSYMDPSVEFIVGHLNDVSYDANIVNGGSKHVKADAVNSAVGRLGFGIGRETSNIFAKLALAHELSSKVNTT